MKKQFSILAIMAVVLLAALAASPVAGAGNSDPGKGELIGVFGVIPGQDLMVHVLVLVRPGADKNEVARQALANQGAQPIDSDEFSTTGLVWDQFFDGDAGNDQVLQYYNEKNDPTGGVAQVALVNTQNQWSGAGSSFKFSDGGLTGRCPSLVRECPGRQKFDDNNDVAWLALSGCCTLGVTWFGTSIDEADMALNTNFDWATNGIDDFDVESVYLHENGHVVGLGHSEVTGAVMEAVYAGPRRALHDDDILGINTLYPAGNANEPPVMTITSPDNNAAFASGATIAFAGTAADTEDDADADASVTVSWVSSIDGTINLNSTAFSTDALTDGVHTITATATDSGGATGSDSISILVGPPPAEATSIDTVVVSYATSGGKNGDKNLLITITVVDDLGNLVESASVSIELSNKTKSWTGTGSTGADGTVTFRLRNAREGHYSTDVTDINADGLTWDGVFSDPGYEKQSGNNNGNNGALQTE